MAERLTTTDHIQMVLVVAALVRILKRGVTISSPSDIVIGKGGTGATAFAGKNANINHNNGSGSPGTAAGRGEKNGWVTTGFGYTG